MLSYNHCQITIRFNINETSGAEGTTDHVTLLLKCIFPLRVLTDRWASFSVGLSQLRQRHAHFGQEWDKVKTACETLLKWIADVTSKVIADVDFKVRNDDDYNDNYDNHQNEYNVNNQLA